MKAYDEGGTRKLEVLVKQIQDHMAKARSQFQNPTSSTAMYLSTARTFLEIPEGPFSCLEEGEVHAGLNIIFDVRKENDGNPVRAAERMQERLFREGRDQPNGPYPEENISKVPAEDVLSGKVPSLCRHRVALLYTLFEHYGVPAKVRLGWIGNGARAGEFGNHVWVEAEGKVFDATNYAHPTDKEKYYRDHVKAYVDDAARKVSLTR